MHQLTRPLSDHDHEGEQMRAEPAERVFRSYETVAKEVDQDLEVVEGKIPRDLRGVHYRNGSGRMERGGAWYGHPFDGDGMVSRFAYTQKGIHYRNRFVRTRWYLEEEKAGRILYRNFGTNIPGGVLKNLFRVRFKNAANTSVICHGGKLLALWEGGPPHLLDPETLATLGTYDFDGVLIDPDPLMRRLRGRELPFSAHPKVDPSSGDLYNFGMVLGRKPELRLYRVQKNGQMEPSIRVKLDALGFLHDFAWTPNWRIFLFGPLTFDVPRMLLGLKPPMACAHFASSRATQVILVPQDGSQPVWLHTSPGFVFHFCNAFEDGTDRIIADGLWYERFPEVAPFEDLPRIGFGDFPRMMPTRFVLDLKHRTVKAEQISDYPGELPRIHPEYVGRPYRFFWCSATSSNWSGPYLSGVIKVDTEMRTTVFRDFAPDLTSEPMFVPRPDSVHEDDGWLLVTVYRSDEHRSDLLVLDATDLSTVCRARLPHHESPGFHGTWVPADV